MKQLLRAPPRGGRALELRRGSAGARARRGGRTNAGIAKELWLTEKTVETHVRSILGKLDLPRTATRTVACSQSSPICASVA